MVLEIEFVLQELAKMHSREKSLRLKNYLEQAMHNIREYNRAKKES